MRHAALIRPSLQSSSHSSGRTISGPCHSRLNGLSDVPNQNLLLTAKANTQATQGVSTTTRTVGVSKDGFNPLNSERKPAESKTEPPLTELSLFGR